MKRWFLLSIALIIGCSPMKKAQKSLESGDYRETIQICQAALKSDSTNAEIYELLGKTYFQIGILDSALLASEKAYHLDKTTNAKTVLFDIHTIFGDTLYQKKDYRKATEEYEKALKYIPNEPHLREKMADSYFARGLQDKSMQIYKETLAFVTDSSALIKKMEALEGVKKEADDLIKTGRSLLKRKKLDAAKRIFEKALKLKPDHREARYLLYLTNGHILYKKGKLGSLWDAIEQYGLASALKPELAEPHYYMGLAYHRKDKKEYQNAFREFETAIKLQPNSEFAKLSSQKLKEEKRRKELLEDFWNAGRKKKN